MPSESTASSGRRVLVSKGLPDSSDSVPFGAEANGLLQLDASALVPTACLPSLALTSITVVANQAARLALTAQPGDVAKQTDTAKTYMLSVAPASVNGNWIEITATGAQTAAQVPFTPTGTIAATDVQAAIAEVAAEASGGGSATTVSKAKATDQSRTSSTVLTNDTDLTFSILASETWTFEFVVPVTSDNASSLNYKFAVDSGAGTVRGGYVFIPEGTGNESLIQASTLSSVGAASIGDSIDAAALQSGLLRVTGTVAAGASGRTVTFKLGQVASSADAVTNAAGSYLLATKVV